MDGVLLEDRVFAGEVHVWLVGGGGDGEEWVSGRG